MAYTGKRFNLSSNMLTAYLGALALGILVYQSFEDLGLSTLITFACGIQCFGYVCLQLNICQRKSVAGISARALSLQAISYNLRLCTTTWLKGYTPVDQTGDWLYQLLDLISMLMVLQILHAVYKTYHHTYQEEEDTYNVQVVVLGSFVVAAVAHPDLNNRPLFDTLWTTALYIDVVAMMPQLAMMAKKGKVEALTSHFVGATAISRVVSLFFWYNGYAELAPLDGSFNIGGWAILSAHIVQVVLFIDFLFYYIKACVATGCHPTMDLADMIDI